MNEHNSSTTKSSSSFAESFLKSKGTSPERSRTLSNGDSSSIFQTPSRPTSDETSTNNTPFTSFRTSFNNQEETNQATEISTIKAKYAEKTPSAVKTEARNLLKKIDSDDALEAFEQLYTLSLFGRLLLCDIHF